MKKILFPAFFLAIALQIIGINAQQTGGGGGQGGDELEGLR